ncbi:MAG: CHAT domain-containing protein [Chthoniobacterales bacterium]
MAAGLVLAVCTSSGAAGEKPDPRVVAAANELAQAKDPADEEKINATLPPELRGKPLRGALLDVEYRLVFQGDYAKAERLCRLLERLAREANDQQDVARSQVQLSSIWRELGDYRGTLSALDRALGYYEQHPDDVGIVSTYQGRGITYMYQGDFARALVNLNRALSVAERLKFREGIIPALNSIGEVYREQGLPERAIDYYEKARGVVADDSAWNMAFIFNNTGQAYEAMGDRGKAVEFIEKARAVAEKNKMRPRVATSLAVLGKIALAEQQLDRAGTLYRESLALGQELRDATAEGRAHLGLAEVARRGGDFEKALTDSGEAIAIFRETGQLNHLVGALTTAGRALRVQGDQTAARAKFEEAISAVESMRGNVAGTEAETEAFFEKRLAPYEELISLLSDSGQKVEALETAERASARVLLDVMSGRGARLTEAFNETEAARERELERRITDLNRQITREYAAEKRDEQRLAHLADEIQHTRHEREDFEAQVMSAHPELKRATSAPALRSLEQLAPLVQDGTVAIKFALTDNRCYAFVLRRDEANAKPRLDLVTLPVSRKDLTKLATSFRRALADRSLTWQSSARQLFDTVMAPSAELWRDATRIVVAPDGPLWDVPFRALVDKEDRVLLDRFAISVAPSLSAMLQQERNDNAVRPKNLVLFANPAVNERTTPLTDAASALANPAWKPLPQMEKQARELEKLYPQQTVRAFIGEAAREETAKRELPNADVIEFATHGVLNDRSPLYSYLLLSQRDLTPAEDGLLEARELMRLPLHARLAILCGCETARGHIGAGEGVIGLAWSLLVAGCPSTIVSQWKVDEAATTPLMLAVHRELLAGKSRAEALRSAVMELRKDERYRHPFYWAPFMLVGDPR